MGTNNTITKEKISFNYWHVLSIPITIDAPDSLITIAITTTSSDYCTFKNFGIIQTNSQGIIDESYNGPDDQWFFPAYALRDTVINVNDRICQFRILEHQPQIEFIENTLTDNIDRGGHGSTGIR